MSSRDTGHRSPPLPRRPSPRRWLPAPGDPYELTGGRLCLDFANTVYRRPLTARLDRLPGYGELLTWSQQAGALTLAEVERLRAEARRRPARAERAFRRAVRLREAIFAVFSALAEHRAPPDGDLDTVYHEFLRSRRSWRIRPDGAGAAWVWRADLRPDKMVPLIAHSAVELLFAPTLRHLRECAAEDCAWLFMDMSRTKRRRWCDMRRCGNRAKVRRWYERHRRRRAGGARRGRRQGPGAAAGRAGRPPRSRAIAR